MFGGQQDAVALVACASKLMYEIETKQQTCSTLMDTPLLDCTVRTDREIQSPVTSTLVEGS